MRGQQQFKNTKKKQSKKSVKVQMVLYCELKVQKYTLGHANCFSCFIGNAVVKLQVSLWLLQYEPQPLLGLNYGFNSITVVNFADFLLHEPAAFLMIVLESYITIHITSAWQNTFSLIVLLVWDYAVGFNSF